MSTTDDGGNGRKWDRSAAEKKATAALIEAEAETEKQRGRKSKLEADIMRMKTELAKREYQDAKDMDDRVKAADDYHFIYRFYGAVTNASVSTCIDRLTEWHRLSPGQDIEIIFNSPGGSVVDGFELFDFIVGLREAGHRVTTGCTGIAASMAGILVQAGTHRWMSAESWYMIHRTAFGAIGKTFEIEDTVEWIKRIEARIKKIFASRSDLTEAKIKRNWERKDWWIDSDEALELGLVDEVRSSGLVPGRERK